MFTLLPRVGVELPCGAGTLRFGMSEREAQWSVSTLADVREGWVCGWGWTFEARYGDLTISACGGGLPGEPGLEEIGFGRQGDPVPATPGDVPVVWHDIDLFGYPIPEVEEALAAFHPHPELPLQELGLRLDRPVVTAGPPGAAPRHPATEPRYLVAARLSHPARHRSPVR
ncbi:hypothetical protein [Actinoallomurus bryophytorum]|nr:hypothetical protein [Actinoallomurus bryophytorum]